ncbi:hypothetical protein BDY19DRAFT_996397 [Irpex rosettiformis]|uniref:Uncharacterized protein n=1 Tax=Irpex rosettiformis TaxID=378272 RepID=A0ACB8TVA3_9APHY|nr:hypothetical protein BDY19DRAFT_996397 [Irpex rosettiformis]
MTAASATLQPSVSPKSSVTHQGANTEGAARSSNLLVGFLTRALTKKSSLSSHSGASSEIDPAQDEAHSPASEGSLPTQVETTTEKIFFSKEGTEGVSFSIRNDALYEEFDFENALDPPRREVPADMFPGGELVMQLMINGKEEPVSSDRFRLPASKDGGIPVYELCKFACDFVMAKMDDLSEMFKTDDTHSHDDENRVIMVRSLKKTNERAVWLVDCRI